VLHDYGTFQKIAQTGKRLRKALKLNLNENSHRQMFTPFAKTEKRKIRNL
jgi:hypothetical protein